SLSPQTRADCTDGCFASDNTALGDHAGADPEASNNTAVGSFCMPLVTVPPGSFNTAVGSLSFYNAENGNDNTVIGYGSMGTGNGGIVGRSADFNTAAGAYALFYDSVGMQNTAAGAYALYSNSLGDNNTATGFKAMYGDPTNPFSGSNNTADGYQALYSNAGNVYGDTGNDNVAIGRGALYSNTAS